MDENESGWSRENAVYGLVLSRYLPKVAYARCDICGYERKCDEQWDLI